ncbi:MAG: hypothetical protein KDH20_12140 [Rhodocyclaceae bacterium]|nr:hypothetical protein [Rhodocyclaceae bacterium]
MSAPRIDLIEDRLRISGTAHDGEIPLDTIERLVSCRLEDAIHQGDEGFHIVLAGARFALIGPFAAGGLGAVADLRAARPGLPEGRAWLRGVPRVLREPGMLGLRLFPVPGLGVFASEQLPALEEEPDPHG